MQDFQNKRIYQCHKNCCIVYQRQDNNKKGGIMRILYIMPDCPFCSISEASIDFVNLHLPFGDQIELVDIFSTDPRNAFMAKLFGNDTRDGWAVPLLVVDNPGIGKMFSSYIKKRKQRVMIKSVEMMEDYIYIVQGFLK